ncbi:hypothetical protein [Sporosarcina sp. FSL W7-1283]|uniref:hypothetical protein n=1 Tax=Sporosarcina sp. FSL W7-1283 TaxID=2921560 RepID=UPI0030FA19CD
MECRVCGHKSSIWNSDTLELEYEDTENFMLITGDFTLKSGEAYNSRWKEINLYACPKCKTVRIGE